MLILQNIFGMLVFFVLLSVSIFLFCGELGDTFREKIVISAVGAFLFIVVGSLMTIFSSDKPPVVEQAALDVRTGHFTPSSVSNEESKTVESTNITSEPETVTTTIQNYRFKGNDIKIECSGPTGNIVCKPAR
jgi:hypothetical protein